MNKTLFILILSSVCISAYADETSMPAFENGLIPEARYIGMAADVVVKRKNESIAITKGQGASTTSLMGVLERLRKTGADLQRMTIDMEKEYNSSGEVDALLLENASIQLSRFQLDIEDAGNIAENSNLSDARHLLKKKRSLAERTIQAQGNFSKIALALAGMGSLTVQQAIGEYQNSLFEAIKAEESLQRTFQNLSKSKQK